MYFDVGGQSRPVCSGDDHAPSPISLGQYRGICLKYLGSFELLCNSREPPGAFEGNE